MASFVIGITGAQGVGKTTLSSALVEELSRALNLKITRLDGLGEKMRGMGIAVGSAADANSVAAIYAAHLCRERSIGHGITILDRCAVDALAYVESLGVNSRAEKQMYEEVSRLMATRLNIVVHLTLSDAFKDRGASHETPELRIAIAQRIPLIIENLQLEHISVDASDPLCAQNIAAAIIPRIRAALA